jgi:hypothetical protein
MVVGRAEHRRIEATIRVYQARSLALVGEGMERADGGGAAYEEIRGGKLRREIRAEDARLKKLRRPS